MNKQEAAELVRDHIPSDNWITANDLSKAVSRHPRTIRDSIGYLRDNFPAFPLISSIQGYRFSMDAVEVERFQRQQASVALTTIRRVWTGAVKPYLDRLGNSTRVRLASRQFSRLLEDIGELVDAR